MKGWIFARRNFKEMIREPILYVFCIGFPIAMLSLFCIINHFIETPMPGFELVSLVPGIMMFSLTFVMLVGCLLISKDQTTAFMKRLYTSPMKPGDFLLGYTLPCFLIGVIQECVTALSGWILSLILRSDYFSFGEALLLILSQFPILIFLISLGLIFGTLLNDKSAPGISSVFITSSGILGGAWMPLETMGGFETFCRFLPFYPSVYIGRIITGACHASSDYTVPVGAVYSFDAVAKSGLIPLILYPVLTGLIAVAVMNRQIHKDH